MTLDNVRKTVADLLRLAENDAASQGEVDNAVKFARRLMEQHHLTEDDCRQADPNAPRELVMGKTEVYGYNVRMIWWERNLAGWVRDVIGSIEAMQALSPRAIRNDAGIYLADKCPITFYGPVEEVTLARDIYRQMYNVITAMAKLRFGVIVRGAGRSYAEGFVSGMFKAFEESRRQDKLSAPQTNALIVRSEGLAIAKRNQVKAWMDTLNLNIVKGKKSRVPHTVDGDAYRDGKADGERANVNVTRKAKVEQQAGPKRIT